MFINKKGFFLLALLLAVLIQAVILILPKLEPMPRQAYLKCGGKYAGYVHVYKNKLIETLTGDQVLIIDNCLLIIYNGQ